MRLVASVSDRPGGISQLTSIISQNGGSVKDIFHERAWLFSSVDQVRIKVVLETTGSEHNDRIIRALRDSLPDAAEVYIEVDGMRRGWCGPDGLEADTGTDWMRKGILGAGTPKLGLVQKNNNKNSA